MDAPVAAGHAVHPVTGQAVVSAPAGAGGGIDAEIALDHHGIMDAYQRFKSGGYEIDERQKLGWQIIRDLTIHSLAEEEVVYPVMKDRLGKEARDHALHEHADLKKLLVELDGMHATDTAYAPKLDELISLLTHHVNEEEQRFLPELVSVLGPEESVRLGEHFNANKHKVPTRPHIAAPDKPATGNIVVDRMTQPIDKLRDRARWEGEHPPSAVLRS